MDDGHDGEEVLEEDVDVSDERGAQLAILGGGIGEKGGVCEGYGSDE